MFWTLYFSLNYSLPGGKPYNKMPHLFEYTFVGHDWYDVVELGYIPNISSFYQRIYDHNLWMHFRFRFDTWLWTEDHNITFTFTHYPLVALYEIAVLFDQPGEPLCENIFLFNYPLWGWKEIATQGPTGEGDYRNVAFAGDPETSYYVSDEQDGTYRYVYFRMRGFPALYAPFPNHIFSRSKMPSSFPHIV